MDSYPLKGLQQNPSNLGGERWSGVKFVWENNGLVSNQVSQKLCFKAQSPHNIAFMTLIIIIIVLFANSVKLKRRNKKV